MASLSSGLLQPADLTPFFDRLGRHGELSEGLRAGFILAAGHPVKISKGDYTHKEGEAASGLAILVKGLLLSSRRMRNGSAQHVALHHSGEIIDQFGSELRRNTVSVSALSECQFLTVTYPKLDALLDQHPHLIRLFMRELASCALVVQEHLVSLGRRKALARVAHLLCEINYRLNKDNPKEATGFPLRQHELADLLGMSTVHTNRTLKQLKGLGLVEVSNTSFNIVDVDRLAVLGEFDPWYLTMRPGGNGSLQLPQNKLGVRAEM